MREGRQKYHLCISLKEWMAWEGGWLARRSCGPCNDLFWSRLSGVSALTNQRGDADPPRYPWPAFAPSREAE
jgi:hypothetical protein